MYFTFTDYSILTNEDYTCKPATDTEKCPNFGRKAWKVFKNKSLDKRSKQSIQQNEASCRSRCILEAKCVAVRYESKSSECQTFHHADEMITDNSYNVSVLSCCGRLGEFFVILIVQRFLFFNIDCLIVDLSK